MKFYLIINFSVVASVLSDQYKEHFHDEGLFIGKLAIHTNCKILWESADAIIKKKKLPRARKKKDFMESLDQIFDLMSCKYNQKLMYIKS